MFDEFYEAAYKKLKNEICSAAGRLLFEATEGNTAHYAGQLRAMNEVINIMNKVDEELYTALLRESEKEAAYYEAEHATDESRSKQL